MRITGGLGNQLFQLGAAHFLSKNREINLFSLGDERQDSQGEPDLLGFQLISDINVTQVRGSFRSKVARKLLGSVQKQRLDPELELSHISSTLASVKGFVGLSFLYPELGLVTKPQVNPGIGFHLVDEEVNPRSAWLGFFQSWKYISSQEMAKLLGGPAMRVPCVWFESMRLRSMRERPLVVHVRLGDYKFIQGVGIPEPSYYLTSIHDALAQGGIGSIWLFSDEIDLATQMLPASIQGMPIVPVTPPFGCDSSVTVLMTMSLGQSYVIANSTYSYWAARLSQVPGKRIYAPEPWFLNGQSIRDFTPPDWNLVSR